ncbi:MAG: hypothetical protein L6R40_004531 [Gallowayella cf. fulva]|nr:MAG: hypothetical protein L6R40_004531 [Xanthomendoza cf. fulva]
MSGERKTYFLAPTWDSLSSGPIALGNIITSPGLAEMPIATALPIDQTVMSIREYRESDWRLMLEKHRSGSIGLWGSFLQILGAGGDVGFTHETSDARTYHFDRLETHTFWPTEEYVEASITAKPVQEFLKRKRFHHNVYMITGIKIAFGASAARSVLQNRGVYVHLGVDAISAGIPISGGPQGDLGWGTTETSSFERDSGFVFAFRLREICYTRRRGLRQGEYVKGALFGLGSDTPSRHPAGGQAEDGSESSDEFELMGLADEDVHAEDVDNDAVEVEEDGEICECVALTKSV